MAQNDTPYAKAKELLKEFEDALKDAQCLNYARMHQTLSTIYEAFARERREVYERLGWMPEGLELLGRSSFIGAKSRDDRQFLATDFEDSWFDNLAFAVHRAGVVSVPGAAPSLEEIKERLAGIQPGFDLGAIRRVTEFPVLKERVEVHYLQVRREQPLPTADVLQEILRLGYPIGFEELLGCAESTTMNTWHPTVALGAELQKNGTIFVPALCFPGNFFSPPGLVFLDRHGPWECKTRFPFVPT